MYRNAARKPYFYRQKEAFQKTIWESKFIDEEIHLFE